MEPLHPPYGITRNQPKTLIRWLNVNSQNGQLTRARFNLTIPAFEISYTEDTPDFREGAFIIGYWDYEAPNNFSLTDLSRIPSFEENSTHSTQFTYAISWTDDEGNVFRYLIGPPLMNINLDIPLLIVDRVDYAGQLIRKNFRIEIIVPMYQQGGLFPITIITPGEVFTITGQEFTIDTSVLQDQDYRYAQDSALAEPSDLHASMDIVAFKTINFDLPIILPFPPVTNTV